MNEQWQHYFVPVLVLALVLWRVGVRIVRLTTRQPVRVSALRWRIGILGIAFIALAIITATNLRVFASLLTGAVVGVCLGWLGLRWSSLERTPEGFFYTPHRGLGAAIALIFIGRILFRFFTGHYSFNGNPYGSMASGNGLSPLTLSLFGLLAGFNIAYNLGILRWREREWRKEPPKIETGIVGAPDPDPVQPPR